MGVKSWIRVLAPALCAATLVAAGLFLYLDWRSPVQVTIEPGVPGTIVVSIDGAIATPGVVDLPAGSRLQDLVDASGGFTSDADISGLFLAARLGDGERVTIPRQGGDGVPIAPGATPVASSHLININTAQAAELDQLPGIGPVLARRIVDYRETNGPFSSVDELEDVDGISAAMVERLRPLVTTGG